MNSDLMNMVLPRLAKPLYHHLERFQTGQMDEEQFTSRFETLLQTQHAWLAKKGISAPRAAIAIHAAVLVLSLPGLRAEAEEAGEPLEVVEYRAVCDAASDVASSYNVNLRRVIGAISRLVAQFGE